MSCRDCHGCDERHPAVIEACDGCRHWDGEPGSAGVFPCRVSGSFRAPLGLFTEGDFWCCHWTKS